MGRWRWVLPLLCLVCSSVVQATHTGTEHCRAEQKAVEQAYAWQPHVPTTPMSPEAQAALTKDSKAYRDRLIQQAAAAYGACLNPR
jgi:hypothetical protein